MNVGREISLACALLVLVTAIVASIALYRVGDIQATLLAITDQSLPGVYSVGKLAQINRVMTGNMLVHLGVAEQRQPMEVKIRNGQKQFEDLLGEFEKSIATREQKQLYDEIPPVYARLCAAWDKIRPVSNSGHSVAAWRIWLDEGRPAMLDLEQKLNAEIDSSRTIGGKNAAAAIQSVYQARVWIAVFLICAILSGGGLAVYIVRGLNLQLRRAASNLGNGAAELASTAAQVANSSQVLAQGTSQQAATLEQTAASTQQLTATTRQNSESARQAADAMQAVDRQVDEGNRTLEDMISSMAEIKGASGKISRIIGTIDEIAFQTNILSLNAAVEAARAGQAGVGFAVVADEVRNLAQRSAAAARETAALIEESILKSTEGSAKVEQVARTIRGIAEGTGRVKSLVEAVHTSSQEQARGVEQIAQAVGQMDRVTQSAAAGAQESSAASQLLSAQAASLKEVACQLGAVIGIAFKR
jgi:methyl-accepting chemotaxis protein/methyl-accepting chemotaxis protein-1 (serine sensor receptor)